MSSYIEQILQRLLTPDSNVIKQATKQLLDYFVSDKCINGLMEVLRTSQSSQSRIYAATLLRKKTKNWKLLKPDEQNGVKKQIIEILVKEPEENVRKQIMYFIASTFKYSTKQKQQWPELFKFMQELIVSSSPDQHLAGLFMISILNEESSEEMKPHFKSLLGIFKPILQNMNNAKAVLYVLNSLKNMIPFISSDELQELKELIPIAIEVSLKLVQIDQEKETSTCIFDFFQSLIEYEIDVMSPYLATLVDMVLKMISDNNLAFSTRVCALNYINFLIETQKASLLKKDMMRPIVNCVFNLMCQLNSPLQTKSDLEIEEDSGDDDTENIFTCATQVLDFCALYLPAKKFIKILIEYVSPAVNHENPLYRRAAFAALAVSTEGCADYLRNHYLELLVDLCIHKGCYDSDEEVVSTSFFALCQFSEYLQPNINQFSSKIMRVFVDYLENKPRINQISRLTVRFYDALQSFCENLGDDLNEYLGGLMSKLLSIASQQDLSLKLQRLIICTFSSMISSVKANFSPYFDLVVQMIKPFLVASVEQQKDFEFKQLQIECIDLMGLLAKFISQEKFSESLINDCYAYAHNVLTNERDDAEKRSAVYDLLAGLTNKYKEKFPVQHIVVRIIDTLRSTEGINIIESDDKKKNDGLFSAFDEIDLEDEDEDKDEMEGDGDDDDDEAIGEHDDEDDEGTKVVIENEYVSEKLSALYCLQEISKYTNPALLEYHTQCLEEIKILTNFEHLHIKKEVFLTYAYLLAYYYDLSTHINIPNGQEILNKNLNDYLVTCIRAIECDSNRQLVMGVFDSLRISMNKVAPFVKVNLIAHQEVIDKIGTLIIDAFKNKIYCQTQDSNENADIDDEDQAEYDYMIKEYAGDLVPSLALFLPNDAFDKYFDKVLHYLIKLINKSETTVAEKSFVIGVIGETVGNMAHLDQNKATQLFKGLYKYLTDQDDEVRSNSIFTIGVLCSQSNGALQANYETIVTDLFKLAANEQQKQALDNICGTLCRICLAYLTSRQSQTDLTIVFTKIFELTPLRVDFNEYFTLFSLIVKTLDNNLLLNFYSPIINLIGHILYHNQYDCKQGIKEMMLQVLRHVGTSYAEDLNNLLTNMKDEYANAIRTVIA